MLDLLWIGLAFLAGMLTTLARFPPLIGYLVAGFILYELGATPQIELEYFSDLGINLLLFTIGLKLNIKSLTRNEILGVSLIHTLLIFAISMGVLYFLHPGLSPMAMAALAFASTFSSTVYIFKVLEARGDISSQYGRIVIGIIVIQDILAVIFMAFLSNKIPSTWLLLVIIFLWPIRILLLKTLTYIRHGELLILFGITVAMSGAFLFNLVNVKGDLGALIFGVFLSRHSRAPELRKSLMSLKDFFLLGFFLSIGMYGLPTMDNLLTALSLCLMLPLRAFIYFFLFTRLGLRSRTACWSSSSLFNFGEFGLIVIAVAVHMGWLSHQWLTTLALALSFSFVFTALLNKYLYRIYDHFEEFFLKWQKKDLHPEEVEIHLGNSNVLVFGMGRIGTGAYKALLEKKEWYPMGFDISIDMVEKHRQQGIQIRHASATNPEIWHRINLDQNNIKLIMLAMPLLKQNSCAAKLLRDMGYQGEIASIAKFPNEIGILQKAGVNRAFNLYAEAGIGFAQSACEHFESQL